MAFYVGRPTPAWNPPYVPVPSPTPYAPAPQYGGYYQPPELITKLHHRLSVIDYDLRCPIDLVHLLVKAAMRDPVIAQDIDLLVARRSEEFRPHPQNPQQLQYNPPVLDHPVPPSGSQPQGLAGGTPGPHPTPASAQSQAPPPPPAQRSEDRQQAQLPVPLRAGTSLSRQRGESPEILVGGIPLHLIQDPPVIPRCPRPGKTAAELHVPYSASSSTPGSEANHRGGVIDLTNDDEEASEPREKPADFSKLLETVEKDLGWHGKYEKVTQRRQGTLGMQAAFKIERLLERLRGYMDTHKSFFKRLHILTVMREIITAVLQTEGSCVGSEVRKSAFQYDDNFVWAVEKLTGDQRCKVRSLNDGKWVEVLQELIELANAYCNFPKLQQALLMIDPDSEDEISEEE